MQAAKYGLPRIPLPRTPVNQAESYTLTMGLAAGVQNIVPCGGPTARAGAALGVDPNQLWFP